MDLTVALHPPYFYYLDNAGVWKTSSSYHCENRIGVNGCSNRAIEVAEQELASNKFIHNTFTAILSSCNHGGLVDEGLKYFNSMSEIYGIEQGLDQYVCMVDMLGRAGKVEVALQIICYMPFRANSVTWETLLSACVIQGNVNVGRIAGKELEILKPGNARGYYALASVYQRAGKVEESRTVFDLICKYGPPRPVQNCLDRSGFPHI
ncbi:hypothetical protein J5N97_022935 [Dioscorea zingiberensis]|uniref:Pentatricopeptide repeat-containing protein n=1 Tax=Dioscorea zingiberensis TaxID=325984 RepID=A0A9D5CC38_9LILI|nr:hypothetical protein J5N97_022935 [Dioscorea zingiberensis]